MSDHRMHKQRDSPQSCVYIDERRRDDHQNHHKRSPKHSLKQHKQPSPQLNHISRMPWMKQETEHVQELLEFLSVQLQEKRNSKLPRSESKKLLHTLQQFLAQEELDRNDPLLTKIAYYFTEVQCVDLNRVAQLMQAHRDVATTLEGQDVLLLLGGPSSGKTTTLHCLAGTTFREVDVDGFVHLQPNQFLDKAVSGYETSCSRTTSSSAGRHNQTLQTCTVRMYDKNYTVCDTPRASFLTNSELPFSVEEEIAHSYGLVEAISTARTVRPIFVLSQECLGNRMSGFRSVFEMMQTYFKLEKAITTTSQDGLSASGRADATSLHDDHCTNIPFQYVFTRFEDRYRTRLCKMFNHTHEMATDYEDDPETQEMFEHVVDDIVEKTTPEAQIVNPIEDIPRYLLRSLLESEKTVCDPRKWMKPFARGPTKNLLHAQLKLTLYGILMFLATQDYPAAVEQVENLRNLSRVLSDAREYYAMSVKACKRYVVLLWESFQECMERKDIGSGFAHVAQSQQLSTAIPDMDERLLLTHRSFWKTFTEVAIKTKTVIPHASVKQMREISKCDNEMSREIKKGILVLRNSILKDVNKSENITVACLLLMQLIQLSNGFKGAAQGSVDILDALETRLMDLLKDKEYGKATRDLIAMAPITQEFPSETKFVHYALKTFKHGLERAIEKKSYETAGAIMLDLTQLEVVYPSTHKCLNRGLEKLWKTFGFAIKHREYELAITIIEHMSKVAHVSSTAYDRSRLGIEVIRDRLFKTIQSKNYETAQVLLQQLNKLEKLLPKSMKPTTSNEKAAALREKHQKEKLKMKAILDEDDQHHRKSYKPLHLEQNSVETEKGFHKNHNDSFGLVDDADYSDYTMNKSEGIYEDEVSAITMSVKEGVEGSLFPKEIQTMNHRVTKSRESASFSRPKNEILPSHKIESRQSRISSRSSRHADVYDQYPKKNPVEFVQSSSRKSRQEPKSHHMASSPIPVPFKTIDQSPSASRDQSRGNSCIRNGWQVAGLKSACVAGAGCTSQQGNSLSFHPSNVNLQHNVASRHTTQTAHYNNDRIQGNREEHQEQHNIQHEARHGEENRDDCNADNRGAQEYGESAFSVASLERDLTLIPAKPKEVLVSQSFRIGVKSAYVDVSDTREAFGAKNMRTGTEEKYDAEQNLKNFSSTTSSYFPQPYTVQPYALRKQGANKSRKDRLMDVDNMLTSVFTDISLSKK